MVSGLILNPLRFCEMLTSPELGGLGCICCLVVSGADRPAESPPGFGWEATGTKGGK